MDLDLATFLRGNYALLLLLLLLSLSTLPVSIVQTFKHGLLEVQVIVLSTEEEGEKKKFDQ